MTSNLSLKEITERLHTATNDLVSFCSGIDEELFFSQPAGKWTIIQNVEHLMLSAKRTKLVFTLPKFIVKLVVGKPNRPSRTYDELVAKYKLKLQQGGRATNPFIPKVISPEIGKQKILQDFSKAMDHLINSIQKNWKDENLDNYIAPHPLLGKITLRELCYFTIHHTYHHLDTIKTRLEEFGSVPV